MVVVGAVVVVEVDELVVVVDEVVVVVESCQADADVGQMANRIAGSGISHLVKLRPIQVLLHSKPTYPQSDAVLVVASHGYCLMSTMDKAAVR